jgi:hypothetical protein
MPSPPQTGDSDLHLLFYCQIIFDPSASKTDTVEQPGLH